MKIVPVRITVLASVLAVAGATVAVAQTADEQRLKSMAAIQRA